MSVFATPRPINATLTTGGARVRVIASERRDTVVRVEPIDSTNRSDVKVAAKTRVEYAAGRLTVATVKSGDRNGSVAITVELPAGSGLVLNTAWTDVHAEGPLGDCVLNVASGQVRLGHVAALRGNLAGGAVEVGHVAGLVDLDGGAAGLRLGEVEGAVRYQGATGRVWIGTAWSDVVLGGSGGAFAVDRAEGDVIARGSDCPIRVGRLVRGRAELMNAAGGIVVGIDAGTAAVVDADSTKGAVRNSLPDLATFDEKVAVYARTRRDDIVIQLAA